MEGETRIHTWHSPVSLEQMKPQRAELVRDCSSNWDTRVYLAIRIYCLLMMGLSWKRDEVGVCGCVCVFVCKGTVCACTLVLGQHILPNGQCMNGLWKRTI